MNVKRKIGEQFGDPVIASRIRDLREQKLMLDQKEFANLVGVKQPIVSQWETAKHRPSSLALAKIGDISGDDKVWWYERAGRKFTEQIESGARTSLDREGDAQHIEIKVFKSAGAGAFRSVDETPDYTVPFPRAWLPTTQKLVGLVVEGDSMSPLIETGFIVIVDRTKKTAASALNHMVAASDGGGVAIKYLVERDDGYWLAPHNMNIDNLPTRVGPSTRIIGVVVKWVGQPLPARK
jgi:SOS-response transcriptional repressor LexA